MSSPTMELIRMNATGAAGGDGAREPVPEVDRLRAENAALRRKLAMLTAQYVWTEGGSYGKIDSEIRQYGFRLESRSASSGRDPRIVPI